MFFKIKNASYNFREAWSADPLFQISTLGIPKVSPDTRITFVEGHTSTLTRQNVFAYYVPQWSNVKKFPPTSLGLNLESIYQVWYQQMKALLRYALTSCFVAFDPLLILIGCTEQMILTILSPQERGTESY